MTVQRSIDAGEHKDLYLQCVSPIFLNHETLIFYMQCGSLKFTCHTVSFQDSFQEPTQGFNCNVHSYTNILGNRQVQSCLS